MGRSRCANSGTILAAVRALGLYLDPDNAAMFARPGSAGERGTGNGAPLARGNGERWWGNGDGGNATLGER